MVHKVIDESGNELLVHNVHKNNKMTKNIRYICIDEHCQSKLHYVHGYTKKLGVTVRQHFRHDMKTDCFVMKFYNDKDNAIINNMFYDKWINLCKKTCDVIKFANNYCIDIKSIKDKAFLIRYFETSNHFPKKMIQNNVINIILSGEFRQNIVYLIGDKYYVDFVNRKDIMYYNGNEINVYIDNNTNYILKLKRDKENNFNINKFGIEIKIIDTNHFLKKFLVSEQELIEQEIKNIESWLEKNPIRSYGITSTELNTFINENPTEHNILSNTYLFEDDLFDEYSGNFNESHPIILPSNNEIFKDHNVFNGMIHYFSYYGLETNELDKIKKRYLCVKKLYNKNEYCIYNYVNTIYNLKIDDSKAITKANKILNDKKTVVGSREIDKILKCWYTLTFIIDKIQPKNINKCIEKYKKIRNTINNAEHPIDNDPKNLFVLCSLVSFKEIDKYYLNILKGDKYNNKRLQIGTKKLVSKHNIYYEFENKLEQYSNDDLQVKFSDISCYFNKFNIYKHKDKTTSKIYAHIDICKYEDNIKVFINQLLNQSIKTYQQMLFINESPDQILACEMALRHNISIITGGPGTGKSNTIINICNHFHKTGITFKILSPTGTASRSLVNALDKNNKQNKERICDYFNDIITIDKFITTYNNLKQIDISTKVIIIDEFSMIGLKKFSQLIEILRLSESFNKMIIVGDPNQLPSIQTGNILHDLLYYGQYKQTQISELKILESEKTCIPSTKLTTIHRTDCNEIMQVIDALIENIPKNIIGVRNCKFKYLNDLGSIYKCIQQYNNNIHDTMILIHTNKGDWGCDLMNKEISNILINSKIEHHGFKIGDRIMCTKNGLYCDNKIPLNNGDIFYINDMTFDPIIFHLQYYNKENNCDIKNETIKIKQSEIFKFKLAWIISIHKSQGKEWDNIIIMIPNFNVHMLNKNLLYTAVTRCKKECTILCEMDSLLKKCLDNKIQINPTLLQIKNISHNEYQRGYIIKKDMITELSTGAIHKTKSDIPILKQKEIIPSLKQTIYSQSSNVPKNKIMQIKQTGYTRHELSDFFHN